MKDVTKAKRTTLLQDTFVATTYNQHNSITKHAQKEVCTLELHVKVNIYRMLEPHLNIMERYHVYVVVVCFIDV